MKKTQYTKKTKIINIFGGPGTGKSTTAAGVFSMLKIHNIDCELVTEFAKDLVWENRYDTLANQQYIFAKQHHRLFRLYGKVGVIVTDSPLFLCIVYNNIYNKESAHVVNPIMLDTFQHYNNYNFYLRRTKKYNPNGRYQDEDGAKEVDKNIRTELDNYDIKYRTIKGDFEAINKISGSALGLYRKKRRYNLIKNKENI